MDDFEQQLRDAFQRKEQPEWFEAKVLAAAATSRPKPIFLRWAAATAAAVLITVSVWTDHQTAVRERAAGEAAKARLQLALKITVTELSKIQKTVRTSTEEE